ncbi:MAG: hypothetical protein MUO31_13280 [Thermodesulfovibrionales bacterium]|nr:hypothetical protein [Thermodesulfovibrionales bacterium]
MTNGNTWKWIIGTVVAVVITALAAINSVGVFQGETKVQVQHNTDAIKEIKPEIGRNSEHRIKFEEKVDNMEQNISLILKEVRKNNE